MPLFTRPLRTFLPQDFVVTTWEHLEPFYEKLLNKELNNLKTLEQLLKERSEVEAVLEEDFAWRYIKMNGDTTDQTYKDNFVYFVEKIQPNLAVWSDRLNKKIVQNVYFKQLPKEPYLTYSRSLKSAVEIFKKENVSLFTQLEKEAQHFGEINGAMTIKHNKEELTMQAAGKYLESNDREERELVFKKIIKRRKKDETKIDELLDALIEKRHQVALNAGFENFRDYQFKALGRFDYTAEDCKKWHQAVADYVVPLCKKIHEKKAKKLNLKKLKPWDLHVDSSGKSPLQPFLDGADLLIKTKKAFGKLDPSFKTYLEVMETLGHFDLESRKGKAPGGFNYPLYEIGVPFIFMNAVGTQRDLETIVHEGGHAIHSFLSRDLLLNEFKSTPSEVAELASMSMELISMDVWNEFYTDKSDLARACLQKIEDAITTLPWVAVVDSFQHWLYENPTHTHAERRAEWVKINAQFETELIDYSGFEEAQANAWQKQMHIFEVPFYYIEYGFAQMGAISLWQQWTVDRTKALAHYKKFMKLGYTKTIPEIYKSAGIEFDFSKKSIKTLMQFMQLQLKTVEKSQ